MDRPVSLRQWPRGGRRYSAVLLQDRDAFADATIAYIRGSARHKTRDILGVTAAERAAQAARSWPSLANIVGDASHVLDFLIPDSPRQSILVRQAGKATADSPDVERSAVRRQARLPHLPCRVPRASPACR